MGIGNYCYDTASGVMNGQACNTVNDCGDINRYECRPPTDLAVARSGAGGLQEAINRLQELFAKIYNVWEWNPLRGIYESIKDRFNDLDKSGAVGFRPRIIDTPTLTPASLAFPGGKTELRFAVDATDDQMPIEGVWINWGDGNTDYFRGALGFAHDGYGANRFIG